MNQYMVPNSKENEIDGIYHAIIKGSYSIKDIELILSIFGERAKKEENSIIVKINENQTIAFVNDTSYQVELLTNTNTGNSIRIENLTIQH